VVVLIYSSYRPRKASLKEEAILTRALLHYTDPLGDEEEEQQISFAKLIKPILSESIRVGTTGLSQHSRSIPLDSSEAAHLQSRGEPIRSDIDSIGISLDMRVSAQTYSALTPRIAFL